MLWIRVEATHPLRVHPDVDAQQVERRRPSRRGDAEKDLVRNLAFHPSGIDGVLHYLVENGFRGVT